MYHHPNFGMTRLKLGNCWRSHTDKWPSRDSSLALQRPFPPPGTASPAPPGLEICVVIWQQFCSRWTPRPRETTQHWPTDTTLVAIRMEFHDTSGWWVGGYVKCPYPFRKDHYRNGMCNSNPLDPLSGPGFGQGALAGDEMGDNASWADNHRRTVAGLISPLPPLKSPHRAPWVANEQP